MDRKANTDPVTEKARKAQKARKAKGKLAE
jgi:hypothetical protein